ncbi:MAG TPA: aminoacyl-tRNA hydrolase [Sedimentisphaerales bacterium]|nr:aminoacyl-tRNA hydrolase [Sedimentisphaerales bacterium]
MTGVKMIVGLGNPGREYVDTRHNAGFKVIDELSGKLGIRVSRKKFGGVLGHGVCGDENVILLKPWRFMNCSGEVVCAVAGFYRTAGSELLVVSDDMAMDVGRIRLRSKGSAGGHNGLADIIDKLGTEDFARLRVGIGSKGQDMAVDYVLDKPADEQKRLLNEAVTRAAECVLCWVQRGVEAAMNEFNTGTGQ